MTNKDMNILTVALILFMVYPSYGKPLERQITKEYQNCLFECLSCVELWGSIYDGNACANGCLITNGSSVDSDCKHAFGVGKRFAEIQAVDECKKQCRVCGNELSKVHYNENKCFTACHDSLGKTSDSTCTRHLSWYDMMELIRRGMY